MSIRTTPLDIVAFKDELTNFLRVHLKDLDPNDRETQATETITAAAGQTLFELEYGARLRYVRQVTLNGTNLRFGEEFTFEFPGGSRGDDAGKIELLTAASLNDEVAVTYGYANQYRDKTNTLRNKDAFVYPDQPRVDLSASRYPRVAVTLSTPKGPGGLSGNQNVMLGNPRVSVLVLTNDPLELDRITQRVQERFTQYAKNFYQVRYIHVENVRDITEGSNPAQSSYIRNIDLIVPHRYEITNYAAEGVIA